MRDEYKSKCNYTFLIINDLKYCAFALAFFKIRFRYRFFYYI